MIETRSCTYIELQMLTYDLWSSGLFSGVQISRAHLLLAAEIQTGRRRSNPLFDARNSTTSTWEQSQQVVRKYSYPIHQWDDTARQLTGEVRWGSASRGEKSRHRKARRRNRETVAISTGENRKKNKNKQIKTKKKKQKKKWQNQIAHTLSSTMKHLRITVASNFGDKRESGWNTRVARDSDDTRSQLGGLRLACPLRLMCARVFWSLVSCRNLRFLAI